MRTTKIMGFSVPPETYKKLNKTIKDKGKTKSEFFREMIDSYYATSTETALPDEADLAKILQAYWDGRAKIKENVVVLALAIITKDNKVLIGARAEKDKWVENLSWTFPGGRVKSLDFNSEIEANVKEKTGLTVKPLSLVSTRIHPGSGFKDVQIVTLYFHCHLLNNTQREKTTKDLKKLKWVKPTDVFKYFTTSTSDDITKFLNTIEKSGT